MIRVGIDFGGTKIEAAALNGDGRILSRIRVPNPGDYDKALAAVAALVDDLRAQVGDIASVGVGAPGSVSPSSGLMRNANSLYLNGRRFREDLELTLKRPIRLANDANCFALSEAADGAGAGAASVFGAILGTGCGGGLVLTGQLIEGANGVAGEWGHNPLPRPALHEVPGPRCYCGHSGCLEQWISGTGLQKDFLAHTGEHKTAEAVLSLSRQGRADAVQAVERLKSRLARALASVCNLCDPETIVLGGGLSNAAEIYDGLEDRVREHVFSDAWRADIRRARWGDSSGVRGAARLWRDGE